MRNLKGRVEALEAMEGGPDLGTPFLWGEGVHLADALAEAGLSLDDKPLFAIELLGFDVEAGEARCPIHDAERHLLD